MSGFGGKTHNLQNRSKGKGIPSYHTTGKYMDRYTESKITRYRTDLKESLATTLQVNIWIDIQRVRLQGIEQI